MGTKMTRDRYGYLIEVIRAKLGYCQINTPQPYYSLDAPGCRSLAKALNEAAAEMENER